MLVTLTVWLVPSKYVMQEDGVLLVRVPATPLLFWKVHWAAAEPSNVTIIVARVDVVISSVVRTPLRPTAAPSGLRHAPTQNIPMDVPP